ncbi:MAG: class I SAM-dependent methyltransferase [Candidatus Limnocylindria bacterium]
MPTLEATGPNAEQIAYWNEQAGANWVAREALLDEQIAPLGLAAMDRAGVAQGERVVDVGCGCGQTTLQLGARVGPRGSVTGIDISAPMLERARARAAEQGLANVRFLNADAQSTPLGAQAFNLVFSRFGVMFFADPKAAFANLRASLAPGGRVAFVCWQELARNAWMSIPMRAAASQVALPAPPPPGTPGPTAFADPGRVRGILESAGFAGIAIEPLEGPLVVGGSGATLEQAVEFTLKMGPMARALRETPSEEIARVAVAVREAIAPHRTPKGVILGYAAWIVSARSGAA